MSIAADPVDAYLGSIWSLVQDAGHLDCLGWTIGGDHILVCACGTPLAGVTEAAS